MSLLVQNKTHYYRCMTYRLDVIITLKHLQMLLWIDFLWFFQKEDTQILPSFLVDQVCIPLLILVSDCMAGASKSWWYFTSKIYTLDESAKISPSVFLLGTMQRIFVHFHIEFLQFEDADITVFPSMQIKIVHMRVMVLLLLPLLAQLQKTMLLGLLLLLMPRSVMLQAQLQIMQQALLWAQQLFMLWHIMLQARLPIL